MSENQERNRITAKDIFLGCLAIAGFGFGIYGAVQCHRMASMVKAGVSKVNELTSVDISQAIIEDAVTKAADRETERAVRQVVNRTVQNMGEEVSRRVKAAVSEQYGTLSKTVKAEIAKKAADIDMDVLREEATERAKEMIEENFGDKLDYLLATYNKNLENVGTIYQSIADSMTANKAKSGVTLNVG